MQAVLGTVNSRSKLTNIIKRGRVSIILEAKPGVPLSSAQVAVVDSIGACAR